MKKREAATGGVPSLTQALQQVNTSVSHRAAIPARNAALVMAAIVALGLLFLISNLDLPIVRNGFVYAKSAENIIDHGFNPLPVAADPALSSGKPIGFPLFSVPFVALLGPNAGVKVGSFLGTVFFLLAACLFFIRVNRRAGVEPRFILLELLLLAFNPLFFYQFWSAYPDSLFSGLVLLAFVLVDVIAVEQERDTRGLIVLLGAVIYAAILTKLYGLILGIACPVYLLLHHRSFRHSSVYFRSKITLLAVVFLVLGIAVVLARLGLNPTLDFALEERMGAGYAGFIAGLIDPTGETFVSSIILFVVTFVVAFHFALVFLLKRGSRRGWPPAPTIFAGIYVLGLVHFSGTSYNMRFFLPVFPFVVVAIVTGMLNASPKTRRAVVAAYLGTALFLTLNYNVQPVHAGLRTFNEDIIDPILDRARRLDNLRLDQHVAMSRRIERINAIVEPGEVLYWTSRYYGASTHGVIEDLGVRSDIVMRYAGTASQIPPNSKALYVAGYRTPLGLTRVEDRYTVSALAPGLFRLLPLRIHLASLAKDYFGRSDIVRLTVKVAGSASAQVGRVEFVIDSLTVGIDTQPPFEYDLKETRQGRHEAWATAYDDEGNVVASSPVVFFVGIRALERSISASADDAEELPDGSIYLTSWDLELIEDPARGEQIVGLRFRDIRIPKGAEIKRAYVQFTTEEVSSEPTDLTIEAELAGNAAAFENTHGNISSRERTVIWIEWSPEPWNIPGERLATQRTPDISMLIQEVVALPDWQEGNSLVLIITGSGRRVAFSSDAVRKHAPSLYLEVR